MRRPFKHIDLNDKFSEFEYTPDDSNWNAISGGLNSNKNSGILSKKFSNFEVKPSASVWKGITALVNPNRKKKVLYWWSSSLAASLLVLLGFVGWFNTNFDQLSASYIPRSGVVHDKELAHETADEQGVMAEKIVSENELNSTRDLILKKQANSPVNKGSSVSGNNDVALQRKTPKTESTLLPKHSDEHQLKMASAERPSQNVHTPDKDTTITLRVVTNEQLEPLYTYGEHLISSNESEPLLAGNSIPYWFKRPPSDGQLKSSFSLLACNQLTGSQKNTVDGTSAFSSESNTADGAIIPEALTTSAFEESTLLLYDEEFSTPIYFTINAEKRFKTGRKNRWSLGLGLGLLVMNSEKVYENDFFSSVTSIQRKYLALPIYVKYDFLKKEKLNLYLSAGSTLELGMGGKSETTNFSYGNKLDSRLVKYNLGLGQINVNSSLGSTYKLGDYVSVFGEFSMARYIFSSQPNLWSRKEFWESARAGLVFQF